MRMKGDAFSASFVLSESKEAGEMRSVSCLTGDSKFDLTWDTIIYLTMLALIHAPLEVGLYIQEDYQQWELPTQERHKPAETIKHHLPFTGSSAYAETYHAHPLEPIFKRDAPVYKCESSGSAISEWTPSRMARSNLAIM